MCFSSILCNLYTSSTINFYLALCTKIKVDWLQGKHAWLFNLLLLYGTICVGECVKQFLGTLLLWHIWIVYMTLKYLIFINISTTHTRSYSLQSIPSVTIHLTIDPPILFPSNSSYLLHHSVMLALNQNGICNLPLWRKLHGISSCIMSVYSNNFTFAWIRIFPQQKISLLCKCVVFFNPHCA